jgi:two-component system, OmpR family, response regulator RstA
MTDATILLVDDDASLTEVVAEYLSGWGYIVSTCGEGGAAIDHIRQSPPDLVVLDLTMPGVDGLAVCRAVRADYGGQILMLTALVDDIDEVTGLEIGADDYVRKPVQPRVLLARIRALLRRRVAPQPDEQLRLGPLCIDRGTLDVTLGDTKLDVTTSEFQALELLVQNAGRVVTRDELYTQLRGIAWDGLDRSMDLRISRVRNRLIHAGGSGDWIKSVRGQGYLFVSRPT